MQIFKANTIASLYRVSGYTAYGEAVFTPKVNVGVNVIDFKNIALATPNRTGASASRGTIEQDVAMVVIHFGPKTKLRVDDRVDVYGVALTITGFNVVPDLFGSIQHIRATLARVQAEGDTAI